MDINMLKDESEYITTLRELGELRKAFDREVNPNLDKYDPLLVEASKAAVNELVDELEDRVRDYERRQNTCGPSMFFKRTG